MDRTWPLRRAAIRVATVDLPLPEGPARATMKIFRGAGKVLMRGPVYAGTRMHRLRITVWFRKAQRFRVVVEASAVEVDMHEESRPGNGGLAVAGVRENLRELIVVWGAPMRCREFAARSATLESAAVSDSSGRTWLRRAGASRGRRCGTPRKRTGMRAVGVFGNSAACFRLGWVRAAQAGELPCRAVKVWP